MIRHRPYGRGHAYRSEPDQRVPVEPVADEPLELRATTDVDVRRVQVELERDGRRDVLEAGRFEDDAVASASGATTHLSVAAAGERSARTSWRLVVDRLTADERLRYRFMADGRRPTQWYETRVLRWRQDPSALRVAGDTTRVVRESVSRLGDSRVRFALRLEPGERVVGFGERFNALDQRGVALDSVVFEQYKDQGLRTYLPMPFAIVVGGGWGFHVATSHRVWFDVGQREHDRLWIEVEDGTADLDVLTGYPQQVLDGFLERTGRPALPPDWIFTPWMSSNEWNTQERVLAEVERGEREGIPAGVVVIEAWSDEATFTAFRDAEYAEHEDGAPHQLGDFTFPPDGAWPDPKAMVDSLHARGLRVLLWQIPLLKARPAPRRQLRHDRSALVERGFAVRQRDGRPYSNRGWWFPQALLPDFTSHAVREWWTEKRRYLVEELGIDGFKTDGGEHAWGSDLRYADGGTGAAANNRYPVLYAQAYHELFERLGHTGVTFSRAGFTGSQSYPCHWAGDENSTWEAYRASLTAGLTAGACGIFFWGWDLGGFSGPIPDAELYLRSAAAACFAPIMQYHSEYNHHRVPSNDRTPWNIADRTNDPSVIDVFRRFARLRMALVPYLAEQARACVAESKPLMRALFFDVAGDNTIWDFPYQYFLGDDILVAPVTGPGTVELKVYLPPARGSTPGAASRSRAGRPCFEGPRSTSSPSTCGRPSSARSSLACSS